MPRKRKEKEVKNKAILIGDSNAIENMTKFLLTCGFKPEEIQKFPDDEGRLVFSYFGRGTQKKGKKK